ncbi:uncharacterized protein LOC118407075 [Branchiostoma floridae]|uniref:Uncharacterized protein LOC118407075 n=1 Tax=Branchiostoma floridae TaxID=7739 RepID=A0A9J7HS34_BRAFL|nr:uncharacterized protein LOC118407075 [Branchiostoma floridae]
MNTRLYKGISQDFYRRLVREEVSLGEWLCSVCWATGEVAQDEEETMDLSLGDGLPGGSGAEEEMEAPEDEAEVPREPTSPIPMPRVVLEDSIGDLSVEEDLPVGAERDVTFSLVKKGTKRGADKLTDSLGFAYTVRKRKVTVTYWECEKRPKDKSFRCNASVIERPPGSGVYRRGDNEHNHPPVVNCETNIKIQAEVRAKAVADVFKSAHSIVQETMLSSVDEEAPNPQLPKISNLIRMANRNREKLRPKDPTTMDFELNHDYVPAGFLRGDVWCGERRHLVFASDKQLTLLSKAKTWYCDGTFFVVRPPFSQLFSIHAFVKQGEDYKQVPLVFVLMSRREKGDYKKVFETVRDMLPRQPKVENFVMDFEDGMWGAVRSVFPTCTRKGCGFHLTQAIYKKIQRLGLQPVYYEKGGAYEFMRKLMVLHFLPAQRIRGAFEEMRREVQHPTLLELMEYMEREWLGNSVWSIDEWSVYYQPVRTNNDLEGYHTRLNKKAQHSLAFYLLVDLLHKEAQYVRLQVKMVSTNRLTRYQRKPYRVLQQQIFNLFDRFHGGQMDTASFLRTVSRLYGPVQR